VDYIVYGMYRFFAFFLTHLPYRLRKAMVHGVAFLVYKLAKKHNRIAKANLDLAFAQSKSDAQKEAIIEASWRNMVYNLYEFIVLQDASLEEMQKRISVENDETILALLRSGKRVITVSGHYGCWEFSLPYFAMAYNPLTIISRKLNNPYLDRVFRKARERKHLNMCEKKGAAKCMVKALHQKRTIALTIDQSINAKQGVNVMFFGHKATQVDSPVRLATKLDAVIVPLFTISETFEKHKLVFLDPIEVKQNMSDDEVQALSQKLSDILEAQIRKAPEGWFWQHRRWKLYHPEIYKK